jgi:hypothetical protein
MFGIDQQVQQTADAYRGKPQMLQQKYAQNQQLIDLLALQKLKSDKEEASRQMALSMQGKPQTIADQRESQVLDMTKKEVIDEQAGVMQNKMKQMQDAQKKVLQAAGAPPMPGQATPQPQQPPSAGLAGLAAPNIQGMAGGGIVAFRTGDTVEGDAGEAEARRYMEEQRQRQRQPQAQQQAAPRGGMQAGLDALLAIRPEEIYEQRRIAAARDTNFTPEERAAKERQIQERSAADKDAELINFLLGGSGRSTNAGAIAAGGAAAQNTRNQALAARQQAEGQLIDIGPASRAAGLKAGETAYGHAMPGLVSGVRSGVDLVQAGESAANRAESVATRAANAATADERQRITTAETRFQFARKEIQEQMDKAGVVPGSPEAAPFTEQINSIGQSIYGRLQVPQYFVPDPVMKPPIVSPKNPGMFQSLFGSGTRINRPGNGTVDFNQLSSRTSKP